MDFGVLGLHGLLSSNTSTSTTDVPNGSASSHLDSKHKRYGSGCLQQERSGANEDDWRSSKLSKTESMLPQQKTTLDPSKNLSFSCIDNENKEPRMLSFSLEGSSQNATLFPCFRFTSPAHSSQSSGYSFGSYGGGRSMQLGVFTESQWMELEHQALIYKYITANVPVPNNLLIPIRKAMESARLCCFPGSLLRPNALGWETFHLGFSGNTDPEPGRCRRTDGKKWRCSRDAVADQKYCERHINRGRHRSRKPVEGQLGHSAAVSTTTTTNIPKGFLATSANAVASTVVGSQGSSVLNSFPVSQQQQQLMNFSPACSHNLSTNSSLSGTFPDKENLVSAHAIFNPLHKNSSFMNGGNFGPEQGLTHGENVMQHSLPPFMDDWPNKSQSDSSAASWPKFDMQLDKTQLSISIPMSTADYMSVTSSPNIDRMILSPPRLTGKFEPVHMGLGIGSVLNEPNEKHANWNPMSWETSVGGPLGEVLNRTNKISSGKCKNSSALNLVTKGWDSSPPFGSPTGVLPKTTFGSLSNSSIGSSPRADNKTSESASVGNALVQL